MRILRKRRRQFLKYLLDTATCIGLIRDKYPVRLRLNRAQRSGGEFFVSAISVFELSCELAKGAEDKDGQLLEAFLAGPVAVLAVEEQDARAASYIEAALDGATTHDAKDALVAGQALARKMVLVRVGISPLADVKGLNCQDWGKA